MTLMPDADPYCRACEGEGWIDHGPSTAVCPCGDLREAEARLDAVRSAAVRLADAVEAISEMDPPLREACDTTPGDVARAALAEFRAVSEGTDG